MAAVATQEVFYHTDALTQVWDAGAATAQNTLLVKNGVVGVTLTDTVGVAKPDEVLYGDVKVTGLTRPGVGNDEATAVGTYAVGVAIDGTWEFDNITGVTTSTAQGTPIYVDSSGVLTTTEGTNTRVGIVNFPALYTKAAKKAPIAIGL